MSGGAELPGSDAHTLETLRRLIEPAAGQAEGDDPVQMTDGLVGPVLGALLRRCAIPHEFDPALLARLGGLDVAQAEAAYIAFTELSVIQINEHSLSLHDRWRLPLWRWWLAEPQRAEFVAASLTLVDWFTAPADPSGEDPAARRRMFHLIGCDRVQGLQAFDRLFRLARHRRRFSECGLLLSLVREYDPWLTPAERALLTYHEGKIANDLRAWDRALPLLRAVAENPEAGARLRIHAQARIAHALRQQGRNEEALAVVDAALAQAAADAEARRSRWRLLYEQGEIQRDLGRADTASATLAAALEGARDDPEADLAGMHNSLGTALLKLRDTDAAIASFGASLGQLRQDGDALRAGNVLNNLGLAHLERCDWPAAEAAFMASLASKVEAGDAAGQATTHLNLARVQAAQGQRDTARASALSAQARFQELGDARGLAAAEQALARYASVAAGTSAEHQRMPLWAWVLLGVGGLLVALLLWAAAET